jgi:GT2 family glycosyltransferase
MPTRIIDVDLLQPPVELPDLDNYQQALVIMRVNGVPIGRSYTPAQPAENILSAAIASLKQESGWEKRFVRQLTPYASELVETLPVTIAVCTRDRPDDLRLCLNSILKIPDRGQEIIVVDNCPATQDTRDIVAGYNGRVRYILEPRPGLNVARNRALHEASHEIVLFNDDDARPEPEWMDALTRNFRSPSVLCVTGLTLPAELETKAQEVFEHRSSFARGFKRVIHDWSTLEPVLGGQVGAGANMAVRKSILKVVGPFDEALDAGTMTQSGGDTDMFIRILASGYRIVYEPAAVNWHRHRRSWQALRKVSYGYGVGSYAVLFRHLLVRHDAMTLRVMWWWFVYEQFPALVKGILRRPDCQPLDLTLAELAGCFVGPWAYLLARRRARL